MTRQKHGGRKKGTPNKATAEVKAIAQEYTTDAIEALAKIMKDDEAPPQARVSAANALLDRGHGKPSQHLTTEATQRGPIDEIDFDGLDDEQLRTITALPTKRITDTESTADTSEAVLS